MSTLFRSGYPILLLLTFFCTMATAQETIRPGAIFPELQLPTPVAAEDRYYLQLTGDNFTPSQIKAELLLVEMLNVHCPHCQMQAPAYNELYKLIEANPETKGKIKILAFAAGNLSKEVEIFRQAYQVPFPILADADFRVWRALAGRATPLSIYVRQNQPGEAGIVSGIHYGLNTNYRQLYQSLIQMAATDPAELRLQAAAAVEKQRRIKPILSPQELEYRVRSAFTRLGRIEEITPLSLLSGRQVYSATILNGNQREQLFAEVTSRTSVCDVCHDVHFIYLFDRTARIIGFEPLQLTKYGNLNWNQREVEQMRTQVVGKYLTMPKPFDPTVDAISSATMTSAIIYDSLAQGEELINELQTLGLL